MTSTADLLNGDVLSTRIVDYLKTKSFGPSPTNDETYVLTCVADIARHVGQNPRTVQHRLRTLIDNQTLQVIDYYPRIGRSQIFVYKINPSDA